jgi:hypothetical protein
MYTVDYFIKKFSAIPEDEWTVFIQQNGAGQRCAFGHCLPIELKKIGCRVIFNGHELPEGLALQKIFLDSGFHNIYDKRISLVADINNGYSGLYRQKTPKQRILAALYDIKKMQQVDISDPPVTAEELVEQLSEKELTTV